MNFDQQKIRGDLQAMSAGSAGEMQLWSLVLSAVGIPHSVEDGQGDYIIWVAKEQFHAAQHEIYLYEEENQPLPGIDERYRDQDFFQPPTLLLMGLFILFFYQTGPWQEHSIWFAQGAVNRMAIMDEHQWWRLVTALTLHADVVHLAGNVLLGGTLIHLLCKVLGTGLGWALIFAAGVCGNLLNVLLHRSQHLSVGFSTAVFGSVGIACGLEVIRRRQWQGVLLAIGAGLGLLAMLGTGGERVDLGAHFWGFAVGLVLGVITAFFRHHFGRYPGFSVQFLLFMAVAALVWQAWRSALN